MKQRSYAVPSVRTPSHGSEEYVLFGGNFKVPPTNGDQALFEFL